MPRSLTKALCLTALAVMVIAVNPGCDSRPASSAAPAVKSTAPTFPPLQSMPLLPKYVPGNFGAWQEYVSQENKFRVKFPPGSITEKTSEKTTPEGPIVRRDIAVYLPDDEGVFLVSISKSPVELEQPDDECRTYAEGTTKKIAERSNGKVISNVERAVGSRKGRQCVVSQKVEGQDISQHFLFVVTNDTFFQVNYSGYAGAPAEADQEPFFAGFELLEEP